MGLFKAKMSSQKNEFLIYFTLLTEKRDNIKNRNVFLCAGLTIKKKLCLIFHR